MIAEFFVSVVFPKERRPPAEPTATYTLSELHARSAADFSRLKGRTVRVSDGFLIVTIMSETPTAQLGLMANAKEPALFCALRAFEGRFGEAAAYVRAYAAKHGNHRVVVRGRVFARDADGWELADCKFS